MPDRTEPRNLVLYSPSQIAWASFLGSSLAGCWLLSRNFLRLGDRRKSFRSLAWGFFGSIMLFAAAFFLPESFPALAIPVGYSLALYFLAARWFTPLRRSSEVDIDIASNWQVAGVSLLWLGIFGVVAFAIIEFVPEGYFPGE